MHLSYLYVTVTARQRGKRRHRRHWINFLFFSCAFCYLQLLLPVQRGDKCNHSGFSGSLTPGLGDVMKEVWCKE